MPISTAATQNSSSVTSQSPNPGNSTQASVRRRKIRYKARQSPSDIETQDTYDTTGTQRSGIASYYLETAPSNTALPPYHLNSYPWTPSSAYRQSAHFDGAYRMSSGTYNQTVSSRMSFEANRQPYFYWTTPLSTFGAYRQGNDTVYRISTSDMASAHNKGATRMSFSGSTRQSARFEGTTRMSTSGAHRQPVAQRFGSAFRTSGARQSSRSIPVSTSGTYRQSGIIGDTIRTPATGGAGQTSRYNTGTRMTSSDDEWQSNFNRATRISPSGATLQTSTSSASTQASTSGATSQTSTSGTTRRPLRFNRATGKFIYGATIQSPSSATSTQTSTSNSQTPTSNTSNQTSTNRASSQASTSDPTPQTSTSDATGRPFHFDRATRKWTYGAARQSPSSGASNQPSTSGDTPEMSTSGTTERTIEFDRATGKWFYGATRQSSSGSNTQMPSSSTTQPPVWLSGPFNDTIPLRPPDEFSPLRFRLNDGSTNVDVSEDGSIARLDLSPNIKEASDCDALSARPIRINERVCFRILENPTDSDAFINFGGAFYRENQRDSSNGDLDYWSCPGYCTHNKIGNIVHFYVSSDGRLHYGVNGEESGVLNCKVNTSSPIWAWIEFFGNGAVELVPNPVPEEDQRASPSQSHIVDPVIDLRQSTSLLPLNLHTIKGGNVQISSGVITRTQPDIPQAYVFTAVPMCAGQTIIVQILSTVSGHHEHFAYGLTSCDPSTIRPSELPDEAYFLHDRPEYWTVHKPEGDLQVLDQLTFTLTAHDRVLERQNNSSPKTVMHVDDTQSLWAFLDLCGAVQEVRLLTCTGVIPTLPRLVASESASPEASSEPDCSEASSVSQQSSPVPSETAEEEDLDSPDTECTVCFDSVVDSALYKCGHSCMCYTCALQLRHDGGGKCPLCRAKIVDVIRIFKS